jgi:hypothetical protein
MDFFVMFSSIAGIFGSRGQSNYAAGNTFQDSLARYRVSIGERGSALDLGVFLSAGILSENIDLRERFNTYSAFNSISESKLFALLEYYCSTIGQHCTPLHCQAVIGIGISPSLRERGIDMAYWLRNASFRHIIIGETAAAQVEQVNFQRLFAAASTRAEAGKVVTNALMKKLAKTMSVDQEELDASKPLHTYGVDSLVAVEQRSWVLTEPHADIAIFDIVGGVTIATIGELAAAKSKYRKVEWIY